MKIFCWQFVIFSLLWFSPHGNVENSSPCSGKKVDTRLLKVRGIQIPTCEIRILTHLWNLNSRDFKFQIPPSSDAAVGDTLQNPIQTAARLIMAEELRIGWKSYCFLVSVSFVPQNIATMVWLVDRQWGWFAAFQCLGSVGSVIFASDFVGPVGEWI